MEPPSAYLSVTYFVSSVVRLLIHTLNHKSLILLPIILISCFVAAYGQSGFIEKRNIKTETSTRFHYVASNPVNVPISELEEMIHNTLQLNHEYQLSVLNSITDESKTQHIRWQVYHAGYPVLGSVIVTHHKENALIGLNGILYKSTITSAKIDANAAVSKAVDHISAEKYAWESEEDEALLREWKSDSSASYRPTAKLIYAPKNLDFTLPSQLCYEVNVYAVEPLAYKRIFINAITGEYWAEEDLIHEIDVKGRANTKYRGVREITTDSLGPTSFRLRQTGRGNGVETYNMRNGRSYSGAVDFTDLDNYWNNYNAKLDEVAGDAHFGAEMTYDYFYDNFSRNSFDNKGAKIRSYIHYGSNYVNAFWNGSVMTYGDGNGSTYSPLTTLDICGHEIAHAVTTNSAGLIYRNESGALNESFSDVFGNAVEWFADSTKFSWRMGEDIMASANGIRNMANPKTHRDPATYKGSYWYTGTGDNGGVHTNSGVQNHWFYLLCEGKSGTNDNGDTYTVPKIGIKKAQQIAYRNLTAYLTNSSDYEEARYYGILSAADLYGQCSKEVEATTNAWYAVGVGDAYDSSAVLADFEADTTFCYGYEVVAFTNKSTNGKSFVWSFGDGDTSTDIHPTHQYNKQGKFSVQLITESCYNGVLDTVAKSNYIAIDSNEDICSAIIIPYATWDTVRACNGFVYDHAGESDYTGLHRDTLTIVYAVSDSASLTFEEFDYENKYDSVYIFDGHNTLATRIGGYTGQNLPNGGKPLILRSGAVTIVHFSDPYVVGTGFKAKFEAHRPDIKLTRTPNQNACYNSTVKLELNGTGGHKDDYLYLWKNVKGDTSISFIANQDTVIKVTFGDLCLDTFISEFITVKVRDPITLTQSADTTICQGGEAEIWVKPTGGLGSYFFTYSTGGTSKFIPETSQKFTDLLPGTHEYRIGFTDWCTPGTYTADFKITVRDSLNLITSNDTTICLGTTAALSASGSGGYGNLSFTWSDGTASQNRTIRPDSTSNYSIRLSDGCSEYQPEQTVTVSVLEPLSIKLSGPDTICYGETARLFTSSKGGKIIYHEFEWRDKASDGDTHTEVLKKTETFYVKLSDNCTVDPSEDSLTVIVREPLNISVPNNGRICLGESFDIEINVSGGISQNHEVTWDNGLPNGVKHRVTPTDSTVYTATLTDNCSEPTSQEVYVHVSQLPEVDFELSADEICLGDDVEFKSISKTSGLSDYVWDLGDGNTGSGQALIHRYSASGSYDIKLIVTNNFLCTDSITKTSAVVIYERPQASFILASDPPTYLNPQIELANTSTNASSYRWFINGVLQSNSKDLNYTLPWSGPHQVLLESSIDIGCHDTFVEQIFVGEPSTLFMPNSFTPNGDNLNDEFRPVFGNFKHISMWISNRHGHILWESSNLNDAWDGTVNGVRVPIGTYQYYLIGEDIYGLPFEKKGNVHVLY